MLEYDPVYKLLAKYAYDVEVLARFPAITELFALTRDGVEDVLARTARSERALFALWFLAVTPRDVVAVAVVVFVPRTAPPLRELTVRFDATPRDVVVFDAFCVGATVARFAIVRAEFALFATVARGLVLVLRFCNTSVAISGSAKTERINISVEHTKNVAANKNIVPIAFFNEFVFTRKVIIFSCLC